MKIIEESELFWHDPDLSTENGLWAKLIIKRVPITKDIFYFISEYDRKAKQWNEKPLVADSHWKVCSAQKQHVYYYFDGQKLFRCLQNKYGKLCLIRYQSYQFIGDDIYLRTIATKDENLLVPQQLKPTFYDELPIIGERGYYEMPQDEDNEVYDAIVPIKNEAPELEKAVNHYSLENIVTINPLPILLFQFKMPNEWQRLLIWELIKLDWQDLKKQAASNEEYCFALQDVILGAKINEKMEYSLATKANVLTLRNHLVFGTAKYLGERFYYDQSAGKTVLNISLADIYYFLASCILLELQYSKVDIKTIKVPAPNQAWHQQYVGKAVDDVYSGLSENDSKLMRLLISYIVSPERRIKLSTFISKPNEFDYIDALIVDLQRIVNNDARAITNNAIPTLFADLIAALFAMGFYAHLNDYDEKSTKINNACVEGIQRFLRDWLSYRIIFLLNYGINNILSAERINILNDAFFSSLQIDDTYCFDALSEKIRPVTLIQLLQHINPTLELKRFLKHYLQYNVENQRILHHYLWINFKVIDLLFECGVNLNATNLYGHTPLHDMAINGAVLEAQWLISKNAKIDIQDIYGQTPLNRAVLFNQHGMMELLLNNGASIKTKNKEGLTLLHIAAMRGHVALISKLLELGIPIDVIDNTRKTPLHYASISEDTEIISQLIAAGAIIDLEDSQGKTPLHYAACTKDSSTLETLIVLGATIDVKDLNGNTPLHGAAACPGKEKHLLLLLGQGANPNAQNNKGHSPLHLCHEQAVDVLLNYSANIEIKDLKGNTPLHKTTANSRNNAFEKLIACGADINAKNLDGQTPLFNLINHWGTTSFDSRLSTLSKNIGGVNVRDNYNATPLHYIKDSWGVHHILKSFISLGADINALDKYDRTPLHCCAMSSTFFSYSAIKKYVGFGADITAVTHQGETLLHLIIAHSRKEREISKFISKEAIDINAITHFGQTPLHYAVIHNNVDNIKILINHQADITAVDNQGKTPLDIARDNGNKAMELALLKYQPAVIINNIQDISKEQEEEAKESEVIKEKKCMDDLLNSTFNKALQGINRYLKRSRSLFDSNTHLGFFTKLFDGSRGTRRAWVYKMAFDKDISRLAAEEKLVVLYSLLASHDGKTLKTDVAHALGYVDFTAAKEQVKNLLDNKLPNSKYDINKAASRMVCFANNPPNGRPQEQARARQMFFDSYLTLKSNRSETFHPLHKLNL